MERMKLALMAAIGLLGSEVAWSGTVLFVGDTITATGTGASQVLNVGTTGDTNAAFAAPTSFNIGDSFNTTGTTMNGVAPPTTNADFNLYPAYANGANVPAGYTGPTSWNFQDDFYFTITGSAQVSEATISGLFSNISDLEARIIPATGNSAPVLGPPTGKAIDGWVTANLPGGGSYQMILPNAIPAGSYILQVRGEATDGTASSYSGTIGFVPLPASVWLMLSGLGGLALLGRRKIA